MDSIIIVGRPNVGKSTLFNRIIGKRKALVHSAPGTTRDRNENEVSWKGARFLLIDTGGWGDETSDFSGEIKKQLERALKLSNYVILVVDGKSGFHPLDAELASFVRRLGKQAILAVNKIDNQKEEARISDFYRLGLGEVMGISASHGLGIHELLDRAVELFPIAPADAAGQGPRPVRVILVGKPNVGKSSFMNAICREERAIVSEQAGTTREAVDIRVERKGAEFVLIDTPGLHRKRKFSSDLAYLSNLSAHHAMETADVAVLVIDAVQGVGETEARVAELIIENRCACVIAVNKWDLVEEREAAVKHFKFQLEQKLQFISWAKVVFMSAKTGQRTDRIFDEVLSAYTEYGRTVDEKELRETVHAAFHRHPFSRQGEALKLMKVTQTGTHPPEFTFIVNKPQLAHFSYRRYLANTLRDRFGFSGTPIGMQFKK